MINHSGYSPSGPRSPAGVNSGKFVARRKFRKYLRVSPIHCFETMLPVRLCCLVCPFRPILTGVCHTAEYSETQRPLRYLGLLPSEHTTGERRRQGGSTKTG